MTEEKKTTNKQKSTHQSFKATMKNDHHKLSGLKEIASVIICDPRITTSTVKVSPVKLFSKASVSHSHQSTR